MLTYQIPENQLISDVIRHYPKYVQQNWAASKVSTIIEMAEFLRNMDDINKQEAHPYIQPTASMSRQNEKRKENQVAYRQW